MSMSTDIGQPHGAAVAQIASVSSLRARLWEGGFRPVAVYNIVLGEENSGKNPRGREWEKRARRDPPEASERAPDENALNTGVLCDGLRAIDIDVEDREIVGKLKYAILTKWGETAIRFRA